MIMPRSISFASPPRRGFTLVELLVVISLIVIVLGVVVPSVSRIMQSANYASAVNAVTATLGRARAAAMESGNPTAVAFLFDIERRVYTMQVLELAPSGDSATIETSPPQGSSGAEPNCAMGLDTANNGGPSNAIAAYQPLRFSAPIELPPGTAVFGLSHQIPEIDIDGRTPPRLDQDENGEVDFIARASSGGGNLDLQRWYAGEILNDGDGDASDNIIPWIFPRNDPRLYINEGVDPWRVMSGEDTSGDLFEALAAVRNAMTFAIAFRPDGSVSANFGTGLGSAPDDAYIEWPNEPLDESGGVTRPYDHADRFDPGCLHPTDIGLTRPNPEVRLRTASLLAVVDLRALQAGAGVNSPWLARPASSLPPRPSNTNDPKVRFINDDIIREMSDWIDRNAQVIGFNRYTGATVKR